MKLMNKLILVTMGLIILGGCYGYYGPDGRRGYSSSLVDYLYPEGQVPPKHGGALPHLKLPLNVGLAFVPTKNGHGLPEANRASLLEEVKQKFSGLEYIQDITVIPDTYMRSAKGFEGVGQIARLYGLDVMALVSYDQVSVSNAKKSSFLYWTIVGAYVIKGNENQVTTFVDTAVFDISSRKMLFRAPGVSDTSKSSTLVEVEKVNRQAREEGFELAMTNMAKNLSAELNQFEERVKNGSNVVVSQREGYGGGGVLGWFSVVVMLVLSGVQIRRK